MVTQRGFLLEYRMHHSCQSLPVCVLLLFYILESQCGEGRESPLVMMPSDPVILRGVTHPSVKECDGEHPPTLILNPTSTSTTASELWFGLGENPGWYPLTEWLAKVSAACDTANLCKKKLVNTITTQFQLFKALTREHIDLFSCHCKTSRTEFSSLQEDSAVKRLSDRLAVSTQLWSQ